MRPISYQVVSAASSRSSKRWICTSHLCWFATCALALASESVWCAVTLSPTFVSSVEGAAFNGAVATFTTTDANPSVSNYLATIDWGDGATTAGNVLGSGGSFAVTGAHTYTQAGSYTVSIAIFDLADSTTGHLAYTVAVQDAPLSARSMSFDSTPGVLFSGEVARFFDANPDASVGDFSASIDWGDAATTAGTISVDPAGGFDVSGSHDYVGNGLKTVTVVIHDFGGSNVTVVGYNHDHIFVNGFGG